MTSACKKLGAAFDERSFDCVYTVNFFAGSNQSSPMASRKRYAGDTFVCMQEWFGTNVTTFKENAYRETRSQTAASSAMLGSGVGTAAGLISSGAIGRAVETQKAKKDLKKECEAQDMKLKNGECVADDDDKDEEEDEDEETPTPPQQDGGNNPQGNSGAQQTTKNNTNGKTSTIGNKLREKKAERQEKRKNATTQKAKDNLKPNTESEYTDAQKQADNDTVAAFEKELKDKADKFDYSFEKEAD